MTLEKFTHRIIEYFLAISGAVGLIVAALPPSLMFGFAAQHALLPAIGYYGSVAVAISLATALETAGVKVSHNTLMAFQDWRRGNVAAKTDFLWLAALTVVYLAAGVIAIWFFDENPRIRLAGFLSYTVAAVMYVGSGFEAIRRDSQHGDAVEARHRAEQLQSELTTAQVLAARLQTELAAAQALAATTQKESLAARELAPRLQAELAALQAEAAKLREANMTMQEAYACWQRMNYGAQAIARFNTGLLDEHQAMIAAGIKDKRTLRTHAKFLNGV